MSEFLDYYKDNKNNLSYWFPKIKDCGIEVPETIIIDTPEEIGKAYFMDKQNEDMNTVLSFVEDTILSKIPNNMYFLFMKNGTFSNKFDFRDCKVRRNKLEIAKALINQNYFAEMYGAGGLSEIVFREFIGSYSYIDKNIPTIYHGMPLRPEFRVFYDFDNRKVLYSANYWDWDYCYETISNQNVTDKIVYEHRYPAIKAFYEEHHKEVEDKVAECMKSVDLTGKWSVDIMWDEESKIYYLMDMAIAEDSAYWKE